MKSIIFDTGAVISLAMNDLLWTLYELKKKFKGGFIIPDSVKTELIDKSLKSKKYKFEAMLIMKLIEDGILNVHEKIDVSEYLSITNSIFKIRNKNLKLIHEGELEALVLANKLKSELYVVDERTMRLYVEDALKLKSLLERKFHSNVYLDKKKLKLFQDKLCCVKICRSTELMAVCYELGIFNKFKNVKKKEFLDGLFWALKLRGVSISSDEIKVLIDSVR